MEILGIGPLELMLIFIVALVVIKPEDWGNTGRTLAKWINQITTSDAYRAITESWRAASQLSNDLRREANLEKSLHELDEFTTGGIYRINSTNYADIAAAHMPGAPEAGEAATNSILPPRSAPYVAAPIIQPTAAKPAVHAKSKTNNKPKSKPKTGATTKRKPNKTDA